jgi:DNA polymerase
MDIKAGAWAYALDPSAEILCISYSLNKSSDIISWSVLDGNTDNLKPFFKAIKDGYKIHAWNANFERAIWDSVAVKKLGWPEIKVSQWRDDMAVAAYYSYPLSLKRCGDALGLAQEHLKDRKGTLLINKFSKPRTATKNNPATRIYPHDDIASFNDYINYNRQDVRAQMAIVEALPKSILPEREQTGWALDSEINKKGVMVDRDMVSGAVKLIEQYKSELLDELRQTTDGEVTSARQVSKLQQWLSENGCVLPNLRKATLKNFKDSTEYDLATEKAKKALDIRSKLSLSSVDKYKAILASSTHDSRVRGCLQYAGATRTGRFAGRLIQIQNFPRGKKLSDEGIELIASGNYSHFKNNNINIPQTVSDGLRQSIICPEDKILGIADYSSIENRVLAWYAGDTQSLDDFTNGADQYKRMASRLFNVEYDDVTQEQRQIGKVIILGCGYGMSGGKFFVHANEVFKLGISEDEAKEYVSGYRNFYFKNVKLWRNLENAAKDAIKSPGSIFPVGVKSLGRVIYKKIGKHLYCKLPSGRVMCYPKASIEQNGTFKNITFMSEYQTSWVKNTTYGGKLCENICQATSRDLLVDALIKLYNKGYDTVAHVHDEIITELRLGQSLEEMIEIMTDSEDWAKGLPLKAEGFTAKRYSK